MRFVLLGFLFFGVPFFLTARVGLHTSLTPTDKNTVAITATFTLPPNERVYKDSISFSVDNPHVELTEWQTPLAEETIYDENTRQIRTVLGPQVTLTMHAKKRSPSDRNEAHIIMTYQQTNQNHPEQTILRLPFQKPTQESESITQQNNTLKKNVSQTPIIQHAPKKFSWSDWLSSLMEKTQSMPIRLFLAFLLGMLLSLTPCIYPMIPITVGILQSKKSNSVLSSFLLAFSYTLGISTTFACLGLVASYSGPLYGRLLVHPISVLFIVGILGYFALSMLGVIDFYVPRFIPQTAKSSRGGSLTSAFMFGAASGTIASPCISPGLILILSLVATMNNLAAGFLLLFGFGLGLSTPLLLVGTFSHSLNLLPQAGTWMIEIKKIFGLLLIGVCLYYLSNIVSATTVLLIASICCLAIGIMYLYQAHKEFQQTIYQFKLSMGIIAIVLSMVALTHSAKMFFLPDEETPITLDWQTDYQASLSQAQATGVPLLLDFGASYCTICKVVEKNVLQHPDIAEILKKFILVKVDGTNANKEPYKTLQQQFNIIGFPTIIIINPVTQEVLTRWHSELIDIPRNEIMQQLTQLKTSVR